MLRMHVYTQPPMAKVNANCSLLKLDAKPSMAPQINNFPCEANGKSRMGYRPPAGNPKDDPCHFRLAWYGMGPYTVQNSHQQATSQNTHLLQATIKLYKGADRHEKQLSWEVQQTHSQNKTKIRWVLAKHQNVHARL